VTSKPGLPGFFLVKSVSDLCGTAQTLYLFVFTHFLTENRFALFLEML
jgi:hypothetical protein